MSSCIRLGLTLVRWHCGSQILVDVVLNSPFSKLETIYLLHNELQDEGVLEIVRAITPTFDPETDQ